jgi:hypothetical protein
VPVPRAPAPAAPAPPSARVAASAQKAQAAASRAIAAGQKLSRHKRAAGQRLIATGNAHAARAQAMLSAPSSARQQRGAMGYIGQVQGPDPGVVDPQSDAVNAIAQLGEMANQMLDWVTTLQTSGPQAALHQVVQAGRAAM